MRYTPAELRELAMAATEFAILARAVAKKAQARGDALAEKGRILRQAANRLRDQTHAINARRITH